LEDYLRGLQGFMWLENYKGDNMINTRNAKKRIY